jgi:hypothetical protein
MSKAKIILIAAFILALGAGMVVGMVAARTAPPANRRSWLADELSLSPDQQDKMKTIWSEVMDNAGRRNEDRRRALQKEREDRVLSLLTDAQKVEYKKLIDEFAAKRAELDKEREKSFKEAVERTKQILSAPQRARYEEILKHGPPGPGPGPGPGHGRGPGHEHGHRPPGGPPGPHAGPPPGGPDLFLDGGPPPTRPTTAP